MEKNLKNIKKQFKKNGIFYTPPELAEYARSFLPQDADEVYDPTAGQGNLLAAFGDEVKKYGQELDSTELEKAKEKLKNFTGEAGDTLKQPAFTDRKFKYIIANPPFSVAWEQNKDARFDVAPAYAPKSKADYAFILHIISMMADGGKAVIIEYPGILYRGNAEGKIRRWMVESGIIEKVVRIPGKKFTDTATETVILVLNKGKKSKEITFTDPEHDLERKVEFEEIEDNDFCLSVSNYIAPEIKKEPIDEAGLEKKAEETFLINLHKELEFSKTVFELSEEVRKKLSFQAFLDAIKKVVESFATD